MEPISTISLDGVEWGDMADDAVAMPAVAGIPLADLMKGGRLVGVYGKPIDYELIMGAASIKLHETAILRSKCTDPGTLAYLAKQHRMTTFVRAVAAESFMKTEAFMLQEEHIDDIQKDIDCEEQAGDKSAIRSLVAKIVPLRQEVARIKNWAKDLKKMN